MPAFVTLNFDDVVEETLETLYQHAERPYRTSVGADALDGAADKEFTVVDFDRVGTQTLLEFVSTGEQVLVTGVNEETEVLTCARGYNGTAATSGHATGDAVEISPNFGRTEVKRWVKRYFATVGNRYFPSVQTDVLSVATDTTYVELPSDAIRVLQVRGVSTTGRPVDLAGWQQEHYAPTAEHATGQILRVSSLMANDDEMWVTYTKPYDTTGDTVEVPVGGEDLPMLWAAAYAVSRREVSRFDMDAIQEWNQDVAIRNGQNIRLIRELWGEFYRRLDEARSLHFVPKHRPYRKMPRTR